MVFLEKFPFYVYMSIILTIININLTSQCKINITESNAKEIIKKYLPIVYYHQEEKHFPAAIEWFEIDWNSLDNFDYDAKLKTNYMGPEIFRNEAPVYSSLEQMENGLFRIIYYFLHGFNDCGFRLRFLNYFFWEKEEEEINVCPGGRHWSDIEGIHIYLNENLNVSHILYNYHNFNKTYSVEEIEWNQTHPIVYSGRGSHASYPTQDKHDFELLWDFNRKFAKSKCSLTDFTGNYTRWFSQNPRLLKLNGIPVSDISFDEFNIAFKFKGRLGKDWENKKSENLVNKLKNIAKKISFFSKNMEQKIINQAEKIEELFNSKAPVSFAGRIF